MQGNKALIGDEAILESEQVQRTIYFISINKMYMQNRMLVVDIDFAVVLEGARLSISAWKCSFIIVIGPFIGEVVSSMFKLAVNKMRISLFESIS